MRQCNQELIQVIFAQITYLSRFYSSMSIIFGTSPILFLDNITSN